MCDSGEVSFWYRLVYTTVLTVGLQVRSHMHCNTNRLAGDLEGYKIQVELRAIIGHFSLRAGSL
jgi:hypothetical protein